MKKKGWIFVYVLADVLEIALLAGAYILAYYTKRKLGMNRWMVYMNQKWEGRAPIGTLKMIVPILLILIAGIILGLVIHQREKLAKVMGGITGMMIVLVLVYVGFTFFCSLEVTRAYYFASALMGGAALIQEIKALGGTRVFKT